MALKDCPECGKSVSTEAFSCPHCGKPLRRPPPPPRPAAAGSSGCAIAAAVVILPILGLSILMSFMRADTEAPPSARPPTAEQRTERERLDACYTAWQVVRGQLKSPTSAEFGNCQTGKDVSVVDRGGGLYFITGKVDADNSFGAKLRQTYVVQLQRDGKKGWKVVEATILE